MAMQVEDLNDQTKYRHLLTISYNDLLDFVLDHIRRHTLVTFIFWGFCCITLGISIFVRISIAGVYPINRTIIHSVLGLIILPLLIIPVHELLHAITYYISGARTIRAGMDIKQYMFYVTAHRYVTGPVKLRIVALSPLIVISLTTIALIITQPGVWKWSLSLFLFAHTTMCAGDIALLNFYHINRTKTILTWDDADKKESWYYEKLQ